MIAGNENTTLKEVYIGISKLCCLNCDCLLKATNQVLESKGVTVRYGGTHGASFAKNWVRPLMFGRGRASVKFARTGTSHASNVNAASSMSLPEQIFKIYQELLKSSRESGPGYLMRNGLSSSQYSANTVEMATAYKEQLEDDLDVFARRGDQCLPETLIFGLDLCEIDEFNDLFDERTLAMIKEDAGEQPRFDAILAKINNNRTNDQEPTVPKETLLAFLVDPKFSNTQIAGFFSKLGGQSHTNQSGASSNARRFSLSCMRGTNNYS